MAYEKVVAIDGPCGSGKSTIAKNAAQRLGLMYIDTGAMFRALAFDSDKRGVNWDDSQAIAEYLSQINMSYSGQDKNLIAIDGTDLTESIREHHVSQLSSTISKIPQVRDYLLKFQRELASGQGCVMEGRDITTVVFPNAFVKIYLVADPKVRAERRFVQLKQRGQLSMTIDEVYQDVIERDRKDMEREVAPLKKAQDAIEIDSTLMSIEEVTENIVTIVEKRQKELGQKL